MGGWWMDGWIGRWVVDGWVDGWVGVEMNFSRSLPHEKSVSQETGEAYPWVRRTPQARKMTANGEVLTSEAPSPGTHGAHVTVVRFPQGNHGSGGEGFLPKPHNQ
jgi:hypothetical protein